MCRDVLNSSRRNTDLLPAMEHGAESQPCYNPVQATFLSPQGCLCSPRLTSHTALTGVFPMAPKEGTTFPSLEKITLVPNPLRTGANQGWCCKGCLDWTDLSGHVTWCKRHFYLFLLSEMDVAGRNIAKTHFPAAGAGA